MENVSHHIHLTSGEIANLWTQYINDTLSICILKFSIKKMQDEEIKDVLKFALELAESHIPIIRNFLEQDGFPVPKGFNDHDINLDAPPLFTDPFMLVYMHVMTLHGLTGYAGAVGTSVRTDQIHYFSKCNIETMELYERVVQLMLMKGLYSKPPHINPPRESDFVKNQSYLTGWSGKKRPLNAAEISGISYNMQKTNVKVVLEIGFGQVCRSNEIKKYFQRGKTICKQQFEILSTLLTKDDLTSPASWISEITESTVSPFSDKLMLYHIVILVSAAIGFFGAGLAISQRRDLAMQYTGLIARIGLYAEDGAELLIKNGWLEHPPLAEDRDQLAHQ